MNTFWLYELELGSGVYQGCTGPLAEDVIRKVVEPTDGEPFKVVQWGWVSTRDTKPDAGRLIVKRWKNGSVWAGLYSGSDKDSSFDEWCYLPQEGT